MIQQLALLRTIIREIDQRSSSLASLLHMIESNNQSGRKAWQYHISSQLRTYPPSGCLLLVGTVYNHSIADSHPSCVNLVNRMEDAANFETDSIYVLIWWVGNIHGRDKAIANQHRGDDW